MRVQTHPLYPLQLGVRHPILLGVELNEGPFAGRALNVGRPRRNCILRRFGLVGNGASVALAALDQAEAIPVTHAHGFVYKCEVADQTGEFKTSLNRPSVVYQSDSGNCFAAFRDSGKLVVV